MKKFTKICMATALVTFIVGVLLFGVGALFGGLRQLEVINVRAVTGIPFRFIRNNGIFSFGFWDWDDEWETYWDWDSEDWKALEASEALEDMEDMEDMENDADGAGNIVDGQNTGLTADTIRGLDLEVGACRMYIKETDGKDVSIAISGECEDHYRYRIKDGNTLLLTHKDMPYEGVGSLWNQNHPRGNTKIYLYLPKSAEFDEISIDFGAGKLDAGYLKAREIEINAGAGKCNFEGLEASESIELSMGAGKITTDALITTEAKLDIAAGDLNVNGAKVSRYTEASVSMGNAQLKGTFAGKMNVDCSMGNLNFTLEGKKQDYNFDIECGLGTVKIDGESFSNLADDHEIDNGSSSDIEINCAMGVVDVDFTE